MPPLMKTMLGIRLRGTERLFQKRHSNSLGPADIAQGRHGPRLALHHLGEQRESHGDNLAVPGKTGDGLIEKASWSLEMWPLPLGKLP